MIAVSIVSHGHGAMVQRLVAQVLACPEVRRIVVTCNIPEPALCFSDSRVELVINQTAKGFGSNHNAAFLRCREARWCVLNPDIELCGNPSPACLKHFQKPPLGWLRRVSPILRGIQKTA